MVIGNIIDTIEFEQIVETGDETIIAMDLQQKILRALQLTDWKVELDFAALSEALFTATGVIIAIAAIAVIAPEVAGTIVAIMTIGQGIDAAINMIKGIMQLSEALNLIDKARSNRALQVGGEKLKEGILNIGGGIIEALLAKCTMKNLANARTQVLKNVTPQPAVLPSAALPPAAGNPAPRLPELPIGREELTVILNKSAANAVENAYGAEIGIYYRPLSDALEKPYREKEKDSRFIYYGCVPEGEQFVMDNGRFRRRIKKTNYKQNCRVCTKRRPLLESRHQNIAVKKHQRYACNGIYFYQKSGTAQSNGVCDKP